MCTRSTYIAQMFLFGDSIRSSCVAIVVPDEEVLMKWAEENERSGRSFASLCQDEVRRRGHDYVARICYRTLSR